MTEEFEHLWENDSIKFRLSCTTLPLAQRSKPIFQKLRRDKTRYLLPSVDSVTCSRLIR